MCGRGVSELGDLAVIPLLYGADLGSSPRPEHRPPPPPSCGAQGLDLRYAKIHKGDTDVATSLIDVPLPQEDDDPQASPGPRTEARAG